MKQIMILMASLAFLSACSENNSVDEPALPAAEISVSADVLNFSSNGTAVDAGSVVVTSSDTWRLSGRKGWCIPSAMEGKSADVVQFAVEPNTSAEERMSTYTFICGDKIRDVVVKQSAGVVFEIEGDAQDGQPISLLAGSNGEMLSIKLRGNTPFTYDVTYENGEDWLMPVSTRSLGSSFLYFDVIANESYEERVGLITLHPEGGEPKVVRVVQALNPAIIPEQSVYEIGPDGGNVSITVRSNVEYDIVISADHARWISQIETRGLTGSTRTFQINSARAKRDGTINFTAKDGSVTIPVTIRQEGPAPIYTNIVDPIWRASLVSAGYVIVVDGAKCEMTESGLTMAYFGLGSSWSYTDIKSIEGISAFSSITSVKLNKCNLSVADLSGLHNVTSFNAGNNPLSMIDFGDNKITSFDSQYTQSLYNYSTYEYSQSLTIRGSYIKNLYLNGEKFRILDVSDCSSLAKLDCGGCTSLTTVKVRRSQTIDYFGSVSSSKIVYVD